MEKQYFVYILECNDNSLYTGITIDFSKRIKRHTGGKGSKYVRSRLPIKTAWLTLAMPKSDALKLEYKIKQLSKNKKVKFLCDHYQKQIKDKNNE